jgi:hypothetical protein
MALLTLSQMAERLNRSSKTFLKYVSLYDVPHIRMGRDLLFDEGKVVAHLEKITEKKKTRRAELAKPVKRARVVGPKSQLSEALGL